MSVAQLRDRMRGVLGFPITPFKADHSLDLDAMAENVDAMAKHPFCALVAAGGTGEFYSLSLDETEAVVKTAVETVNGRMPVVAGAGYNVTFATHLAATAEKCGADALLVLPPYYMNAPESGLFAYYEAIGKSTSLPLMIYSRDWAVFTPDMVARLADRVPNLHFWKDGQGNVRVYQRIMQKLGDRLAWLGGLGDDCVPGYFSVEVQAYTSSISVIAPKVSLALAKAGLSHDYVAMNQLMAKYVHPLYALRERMKGYEVSVMKAAMEMIGKKAGPVRPPLPEVRPADLDDLRRLMDVYADMLDEQPVTSGTRSSR